MFDALKGLFNGEALADVAGAQFEKATAPFFAGMRDELLRRVTGDPPPGFAISLQKRGWPVMDDQTTRNVWASVIEALAEAPGDEYLRAVS